MKIAILTYGEFRTAKTAVKTWNILNTKNQVDVYVHTQTTSNGNCVSELDIKKLFSNYKLWMEDIDEFENDNEPRDIHMNFRSYRFLCNKVIESKIQYDFIIVNRLDTTLHIDNIDSFLTKNHNGLIYTLDDSINKNKTFIQDHFFMGAGYEILNFLKNLPSPQSLTDSHNDFGRYILSSGLKNTRYENLYSFHLRPNMINFIKNNIRLSDVDFSKKLFEWFINGTHKRLETEWKHYLKNQY